MKIIKHGKTAATCKCKACGCEFTYISKDIGYKEVIISQEHFEETDKLMRVCRYVICPECCESIEVE